MEHKGLDLRLRPAAETDLEAIWTYTERRWGVAQAERYLGDVFSNFERLCLFPELAAERSKFTPPVRIHPSGRHVIVYRIEGDTLEVIRVLGAQQDWMRALAALD